jgi:predicted MPP superfamily phosphohydrolase
MARGLLELILRGLYTVDWPAWLWGLFPQATRVRRVAHRVPARVKVPLKIGFISDLHVGPTTPAGTLDRAFALLDDANLDVLLLGGDYVLLEATPARARRLAELVARVHAPVKLAVLGNHDLWTDHALIEAELTRAGATVLVNASYRLPSPHDEVVVVGLDDPWTGEPKAEAFDGSEAAVRIVLCHSSDAVPLADGRGVSLYVCGHTHGGHIALPGPTPVVIPGLFGRKWPHGLHHVGGMPLFVSRGVGGTELPMRANAPPDVGIFWLTSGPVLELGEE